ncbi:MAG: 50S ribosomal protein L4 [Acidobacteria bacterium]|nr:50S ribosomal protein L4 [Acidobacteriota bacterium]
MATIDVHDLAGNKVGALELSDEVFSAVNEDLVWEAVKHYRAGQRAGTHATKNRWRVSGSGKKLWRQKGTGRARIGSIRSPLWRHGGTVHGPQPRSYGYRLPRKKLLGALRSALAAKFAAGRLMVVNAFDLNEPKTQPFRRALNALKVDRSALLVEVANHGNRNLVLASRNLEGVELVTSAEVHPYHLMRYDRAIFSEPALLKLAASLAKSLARPKPRAGGTGSGKKSKKAAPGARRAEVA